MGVGVGDPAPDFSLLGTGGETFELRTYRGAPVVLVFYPGDDTAVCTTQLRTYNDDLDTFAELGAQILGLSPQGVQSHDEFSCKLDLGFPLLADTEKEVGRAYGVLGPLGFYRRSVFVIDGEGVIRYAHRAVAGLTFRPTSELVEAIEAAG
jgi:thioredoxin-dependent peroxiredoxin